MKGRALEGLGPTFIPEEKNPSYLVEKRNYILNTFGVSSYDLHFLGSSALGLIPLRI